MPQTTEFMESKRHRLEDLYIAAGDRGYMVGAQNGSFPDFGHHIADEMGGVWNHPVKLLDGFWLRAKRRGSGDEAGVWLNEAVEFRNYPFHNEHSFEWKDSDLSVIRRQFVPDDAEGLVVVYEWRNDGRETAVLDLEFLARTDLRPVWFSEEIGIDDGEDDADYEPSRGAIVGKDRDHSWFVVFGADRACGGYRIERELFGPERTAGKGVTGSLTYEGFKVEPGASAEIRFFVAGSCVSREEALSTFDRLRSHHEAMLEAKKRRYEAMLSRTAIDIPDKELQHVFNWVKFNNDWLVRHVPGIGNGLGAGHPEYPWWFGCDNSYALLGLLPLGEFGLVRDTLNLLRDESEKANGNGRIIHELTTFGAVSNYGNTQETPHFIKCVWEVFQWTGDVEWLRSMYPIVVKGIAWLMEEQDPDGDLLPEGYGIIEIEGLNLELIDTAVYTCEALRAAGAMAELFGEPERAAGYMELHRRLKEKINRELWLEEEGLYADAVGTPGDILKRIDLYIERAVRDGAAEDGVESLRRLKAEMQSLDPDRQRPWLFKNWVINTPMETGIAEREQAVRALDRMATDEFTGPWGTYLSGMFRTAMMTISTGVQAVAEGRYGRVDEALRYVRQIVSTFNQRLPGSISEMSPDYGCFVQAWTVYGIAYPLLAQMFGIEPSAYEQRLTLRPRMPKGWTDASVRRVSLGTGEAARELDFSLQLGDREDVYRVAMTRTGWRVELHVPAAPGDEVLVDGMAVPVPAAGVGAAAESAAEAASKAAAAGSTAEAAAAGAKSAAVAAAGEWQDGVFVVTIADASAHEIRVRRASR